MSIMDMDRAVRMQREEGLDPDCGSDTLAEKDAEHNPCFPDSDTRCAGCCWQARQG